MQTIILGDSIFRREDREHRRAHWDKRMACRLPGAKIQDVMAGLDGVMKLPGECPLMMMTILIGTNDTTPHGATQTIEEASWNGMEEKASLNDLLGDPASSVSSRRQKTENTGGDLLAVQQMRGQSFWFYGILGHIPHWEGGSVNGTACVSQVGDLARQSGIKLPAQGEGAKEANAAQNSNSGCPEQTELPWQRA